MRHLWVGLVVVAVVAAKVLGLYTFGFVASGSMEPTLSQGSLFVAFAATPAVGDIVVFQAPSGERIVHRVVAATPAGLVTQGDANERNDVATGIGPVDPSKVQVVPMVHGSPAAVEARFLQPTAIVALQVLFLTIGLRGLLRTPSPHARRLRPHHAVLAAAVLLLLTGPLYHDTADAVGSMGVRAAFVPTVVHVVSPVTDTMVALQPLQEKAVDAVGEVSVAYAPDLPGARWLLPFGSTAAVLPAVLLIAGIALFMRVQGW